MLEACACLGLDTEQIREAAKLDRATLENADARIPIEQADAHWQKAYELSASSPSRSKHRRAHLGQAIVVPRLVARVGVGDRVDIGAWGGFDPNSNYGAAGIDSKIVLMRQGPSRPVSISIRPSVASLVGPAEVWAGSVSVDVSVSRAFGAFSPYVGVATTGALAVERSNDVDFDPILAEDAVSYAGLTYSWRGILLSAEVEKGALVSYGFRIGKRF